MQALVPLQDRTTNDILASRQGQRRYFVCCQVSLCLVAVLFWEDSSFAHVMTYCCLAWSYTLSKRRPAAAGVSKTYKGVSC